MQKGLKKTKQNINLRITETPYLSKNMEAESFRNKDGQGLPFFSEGYGGLPTTQIFHTI